MNSHPSQHNSNSVQHPDQLTPEQALALLKLLALDSRPMPSRPSVKQLMQLLCARKRSLASGDRQFDTCLFELGKTLDEQIRDGAPVTLRAGFDLLTEYFRKLEAATGHLNHLAFMGSEQIDVELLVELKQDMELFASFSPDFFNRLLVDDLLKSQLLDSYGRRRIRLLLDGLAQVQEVRMQKSGARLYDLQAVQLIINRLNQLEQEERLFMQVAEVVLTLSGTQHLAISTPLGVEGIRRTTQIELRQRYGFEGQLPDALFQKALELVKLEAIYANAILPQVMRGNRGLRRDFIAKSGLDLFYIEELEARYCERNGISPELLQQLRTAT